MYYTISGLKIEEGEEVKGVALSGHNICTTGDSLVNLTCSLLCRSDLILSLYTCAVNSTKTQEYFSSLPLACVYTLSLLLHLAGLVSFLFVVCDPLG